MFYNREFSFFNFQFGNRPKSTFETFDFELTEKKVDPATAQIVMFKIFTVKREYGAKLSGIRAYNNENRVVLSVGWF